MRTPLSHHDVRSGEAYAKPTTRAPIERRKFVFAMPCMLSLAHSQPQSSRAEGTSSVAKQVEVDLESRKVRNPGVSWFPRGQTYYPDSFEGAWDVEGRLRDVNFPQGERFVRKEVPGVTKGSIIAALPDVGAGMDAPVRYRCRYIRHTDGVIADRAFNLTSLVDAFLGYNATRSVAYDATNNPTRINVVWSTPRQDTADQSRDLRKAELFINNRRSAMVGPDDFYVSENFRQVNQAKQQGYVYDYEVLFHYHMEGDARMVADMRVAAFLIPSAPDYFESRGESVANYDYTLLLTKSSPI